MKAYYDSEADALSIELADVRYWDDGEEIDADHCTVDLSDGRPVSIELLKPGQNLCLLEVAAKRLDLEHSALLAAAKAALVEPDRTVRVGDQLAA